MNENKYQQLFEKSRVYKFGGRQGESRRVFVFSADLFNEGSQTPWVTQAAWEDKMEKMKTFFSSQNTDIDATIAFDGRSRACRKELERIMENRRHYCELWLVYAPSKRLGRRVPFASDTRELYSSAFR